MKKSTAYKITYHQVQRLPSSPPAWLALKLNTGSSISSCLLGLKMLFPVLKITKERGEIYYNNCHHCEQLMEKLQKKGGKYATIIVRIVNNLRNVIKCKHSKIQSNIWMNVNAIIYVSPLEQCKITL